MYGSTTPTAAGCWTEGMTSLFVTGLLCRHKEPEEPSLILRTQVSKKQTNKIGLALWRVTPCWACGDTEDSEAL